jgi:hypothetical protein
MSATEQVQETQEIKRNWYTKGHIWLTILAYMLPIAFLGYLLYTNLILTSTSQTFILDIGSEEDTSGIFFLEPGEAVGERQSFGSNNTFRELNGMTYSVFKPNQPLGTSTITATIDGAGVGIIPTIRTFDPEDTSWSLDYDFTRGKDASAFGLSGDAFPFDDAMHFDGTSRLELASSTDRFENNPFSIYVVWTPKNSYNNLQQIVGHYNWELIQNIDTVTFQVGRMGSTTGGFYSVKFPITPDFFNTEHTALAIYHPASLPNEQGYIELYVDGIFAYRTYFGQEVINPDYGNENLSLGWSPHNYEQNPHFYGNIKTLKVADHNVVPTTKQVSFKIISAEELVFPLVSTTPGVLTSITLHVTSE